MSSFRKCPYPTQGGTLEIPGGGGIVLKTKGMYEPELEFPEGRSGLNPKSSLGGSKDIFGKLQCLF